MKYVKRVNWPWVEISENNDRDDSYVINMNDVGAIYTNSKSFYKFGIKFKDGTWLSNFDRDALIELRDLIMSKKEED